MPELTELLVEPLSTPASLGGIPLWFDDPQVVLRHWASELGALLARFERDVRALDEQLQPGLAPATHERVRRTRDALVQNRRTIEQLFGEARLTPIAPPPTKTGDGASLLSAWFQMLRDWGWHDETRENQKSLAQVVAALGDEPVVGKLLVLGAGAGRLAYDLHLAGRASCSLLLDNNPLPCLVGRRVVRGSTVQMVEVPRNPQTPDCAVITRELRRTGPPVDDFHFVLADARFPVVRPGSFDTVLTPWYIDRVDQSLPEVILTVYRALAPGGRWINHGPLIYDKRPLAQQLTLPELLDAVAQRGFRTEFSACESAEYLKSAASTSGRSETVNTIVFRRDAGAVVVDAEVPVGLRDVGLPLERFPGLSTYQAPNRAVAFIVSLVDGKRSVQQIGQAIVPRLNMPAEDAARLVLMTLRQVWRTPR